MGFSSVYGRYVHTYVHYLPARVFSTIRPECGATPLNRTLRRQGRVLEASNILALPKYVWQVRTYLKSTRSVRLFSMCRVTSLCATDIFRAFFASHRIASRLLLAQQPGGRQMCARRVSRRKISIGTQVVGGLGRWPWRGASPGRIGARAPSPRFESPIRDLAAPNLTLKRWWFFRVFLTEALSASGR